MCYGCDRWSRRTTKTFFELEDTFSHKIVFTLQLYREFLLSTVSKDWREFELKYSQMWDIRPTDAQPIVWSNLTNFSVFNQDHSRERLHLWRLQAIPAGGLLQHHPVPRRHLEGHAQSRSCFRQWRQRGTWPLISYLPSYSCCLRPKAKDLGITWVFFCCSCFLSSTIEEYR